MTKLTWAQKAQSRYEVGVDRGVLYPTSGPGVVWNGLISVSDTFEGGEKTAYHFDGIKYLELVSPKNFQAQVTAYSAPRQFAECIGERTVVPGFVLTRQPRARFGLSYRTLMEPDRGYKLHLVYNALANPTERGHKTQSDTAEAGTRSWTINAVPPKRDTYRPTAHFVFDSTQTEPQALLALEMILYGTDESEPRMPSLDELLDMIALWSPLMIVPASMTGLSELVPGMGDLYKTQVDGIHRALPTTRLNKSLIDGLYRME